MIVLAIGITLRSREAYIRFLGAGLLLNLFYITYIGGDFMLGRFYSFGYLVAVIVLCSTCFLPDPTHNGLGKNTLRLLCFLPVLLISYAIGYPHTPLNSSLNLEAPELLHGVADERRVYFSSNSLVAYIRYINLGENSRPPFFPVHWYSEIGWQYSSLEPSLYEAKSIGMFGYWAGIDHIILDRLALSDPFLARLPTRLDQPWRIGHFERTVPPGYRETLVSGKIQIHDPNLSEFYEKISLVTQHDGLLEARRIKAIWMLNTGSYDDLIAR